MAGEEDRVYRDVLDGASMRYAPEAQFSKGIIARFMTKVRPLKDDAGNLTGDVREVEMVEFIVPGDNLNQPSYKVTDDIRRRFSREYDAFKKGEDTYAIGTPLSDWGPAAARPDFVAVAKMNHVYTVEALADLADFMLKNLTPDARRLRTQAKAFVEARAVQQPFDDIRAEADKSREEVETLKAQLAQLQALIEAKHEGEKRRPGRPSKQHETKESENDSA